MACGPSKRAIQYSGCLVCGYRFHTADRERYRKTQNCGVVVEGSHGDENIDFYGIMEDIIALKYVGGYMVWLFKCNWWDVSNPWLGVRKDEYFVSVNTSHKWYEDNPFVLACQANQVFYLDDPEFGNPWRIVEKFAPRNVYDYIPEVDKPHEEVDSPDHEEAYQENESGINLFVDLS